MKNLEHYILATDLDRTLLPNGEQPESPNARSVFSKLCSHDSILLVYISGRSLALVLDAIETYKLPMPDYIVADVGAVIYQANNNQWQEIQSWHKALANDWCDFSGGELQKKLNNYTHLKLQKPSKQGHFKVSYEVQPSKMLKHDLPSIDRDLAAIQSASNQRFRYKIVSSIDETSDEGLVDIVPESAGKLGALKHICETLQMDKERVFFSGDSGNDEEVLLSEFKSCLVKNATTIFKQNLQKKLLSKEKHSSSSESALSLHLAKGMPEFNLNGNYSSGIVEGFVHFFPFSRNWITEGMA